MPATKTNGEKTLLEAEREKLSARLAKIDEEIGPKLKERTEINAVLDALSALTKQRRPRTPSTGGRGRRGFRMDQFLGVLKDNPDGIRIADAAKAMDVSQNYLYRVGEKAVDSGKAHKDDDGLFYLTEVAADEAAEPEPAAA